MGWTREVTGGESLDAIEGYVHTAPDFAGDLRHKRNAWVGIATAQEVADLRGVNAETDRQLSLVLHLRRCRQRRGQVPAKSLAWCLCRHEGVSIRDRTNIGKHVTC